MFKRLRMSLTLICTLFTGVILTAMAIASLAVAETQLRQRADEAFLSGVNTVLNYIGSEQVLRYAWLVQTEADEKLMIDIEKDSHGILYTSLRAHENRSALFEQARNIALRKFGFSPQTPPESALHAQKVLFEFDGGDGARYCAAVAAVPAGKGYYRLTILQSLREEQARIAAQRWRFAALILAALVLLLVFSFLFTSRAVKPVEESRKRQTAFVSAASHELRTPLSVIQSGADALLGGCGAEQAAAFARLIASESGRMARLVDDMLTLARSDSGSWSLRLEQANLESCVLNAAEAFEISAAKKGIRLDVSLPPDVLLYGWCDVQRIEQVLGILLDNALSYTQPGGRVTLSADAPHGCVRLCVADNGPGIPDALKGQVFERFARGDTSRSSKEHYGLGLSIAAEIAALHRGNLAVKDTPGGGSTFVLTLPRAVQHKTAPRRDPGDS